MIHFARTNTSPLSQWWWTVDRWLLGCVMVIIAVGILMSYAASPSVAETIGQSTYYFVKRQLMLLPFAIALMIGVSLLNPRQIKLVGICVFTAAFILLFLTLFIGVEIKGARRWIQLAGFSLQPSELIKPSFAVVAAWLFSEQRKREYFKGDYASILLWLMTAGLMVAQPDLGMTFVLSAVWGFQWFLAGLSIFWVSLLAIGGVGLLFSAYHLFPHFASRIDRFLDPSSGDTYQAKRALEAFMNGGFFGTGPGEGTVKDKIPDVHADFVFAAAGEEFGMLICIFIVCLFAFVVLRGLKRLNKENDLFIIIASAGLLVQFGLQAVINMASTLSLMPTKGMTLPFVSYGGSSLLGVALGMGMLLGLTRRRPTTEQI
jgi:cell division protein FtsW